MKIISSPKKSLGQNFLIDKNIIKKIVGIADINKKKIVLEIGPGYGNLTNEIVVMEPKKIIAVEKDKKLSQFLNTKFKDYKNIEIINQDILELINKKKINNNVIVFGNLPYNISTKILASLITQNQWPPWYDVLIFMFQKEVADRILAKTNTKEFGRLAVLANWRLEINKHFNISKNCFFPKPKVNSTLLSFKPKKNYFKLKKPENLEKINQIFFSNRRKMINKNFKKIFGKNMSLAKDLNIDLTKRPEQLSNEMFYKIVLKYEELTN